MLKLRGLWNLATKPVSLFSIIGIDGPAGKRREKCTCFLKPKNWKVSPRHNSSEAPLTTFSFLHVFYAISI